MTVTVVVTVGVQPSSEEKLPSRPRHALCCNNNAKNLTQLQTTMSSAAIYYGAPASRNQQVSEELKSRGINLLRSSPAEAFPDVDRHVNTLQYQNYFNNLGAAFDAAINDKYIYLKTQVHYFVPTTTFNPPYMRTPTIVWNYGRGVTPDNLSSIRERFHAIETVAKGQPALMATLSPTQVRDLLHDTAPSQITAASTTTINIGAYRMYLRLHKLADLFFRVHQYPLSADGKTQSEYFRDAFLVNQADIEKSMSTVSCTSSRLRNSEGYAVQCGKGRRI